MKLISSAFYACSLVFALSGCQRQQQGSIVSVDDGSPSDKEDMAFQCSAEVDGVSYFAAFGMYRAVQPARMYLRTNMRQGEASGPWANAVGRTDHAYGRIGFAAGDVELFGRDGELLGRFTYVGSQSEEEVFFGLRESLDTRMMAVGEGKGEFLDMDGNAVIKDLACVTLGGETLSAPEPADSDREPADPGF